jgi:hypothetical protein
MNPTTNMENTGVSKYTISFGLSLALASVVNGVLIVAKEKIPAVLAGMQKLTGHHWISHSVIVLGLFAVFGWLFAQANGGQGIRLTVNRLIVTLVSGATIGSLVIWDFIWWAVDTPVPPVTSVTPRRRGILDRSSMGRGPWLPSGRRYAVENGRNREIDPCGHSEG